MCGDVSASAAIVSQNFGKDSKESPRSQQPSTITTTINDHQHFGFSPRVWVDQLPNCSLPSCPDPVAVPRTQTWSAKSAKSAKCQGWRCEFEASKAQRSVHDESGAMPWSTASGVAQLVLLVKQRWEKDGESQKQETGNQQKLSEQHV